MEAQDTIAQSADPGPKKTLKFRRLSKYRKLIIFITLSFILLNLLNFQNFSNKLILNKANAESLTVLLLPTTNDIFISPSTSNGNRRMLFVGTYTDDTICGTEGCPPVYSDSYSLLNFDWSTLPTNAIVLSAKLQLYHYGSNAPFTIKISKVDSTWSETTTSLNSPTLSGNFGTYFVPEFNTSDPNQITLREINIDPTLIDISSNLINGIALTSNTNIGDPGAVFCSKDSDTFCLPEYAPKLQIEYVPNHPPQTPILASPESFYGGNCDSSIFPEPENCLTTKNFTFNASNLIDTDPASGAFAYSKFFLTSTSPTSSLESPQITTSPNSTWNTDLENGNYSLRVDSVDGKGEISSSITKNFIYDSTPPEIPVLQDLADITNPTANQISIKIKSNPVTDNISPTIQYQIQYSTDSAFLSSTNYSDWSTSSEITLTNANGIEPGKNYFFRMRAKDAYENFSDWSNTSATSITGLPLIPQITTSAWKINRFKTSTFVTNQRNFTFTGYAEKNKKVEIFINNAKNSDAIANRNCFIKDTKEFCYFSSNYNYTGSGANDSNGTPLKSYSVQFRSVDENQNTSVLTPRKIIYFDNVAPIAPTILSLISEKNTKDIDGITTINGNKISLNLQGEKYSDIEFKLYDPKNKLVESKLVRVQSNKEATTSSANLKLDGKYRLELTSIDGAGNRSTKLVKEFVRDSVGPIIEEASINSCNENICLNIKTEYGAEIISNNLVKGTISAKPQTVEIVKYWSYGKIYKFNIYARDKIGNFSAPKVLTLETDSYDSGGRGAAGSNKIIEVDTAEYESIKNQKRDFEQANLKIDFHPYDNSYKITETNIPAPVLEASVTNYDKSVDVFGNSIYRNLGVKVQVRKVYKSFNEAKNSCGWNIGCYDNELGLSLYEYLNTIQYYCNTRSVNIIAISLYCSATALDVRKIEDYQDTNNSIDEMKVTLIRNEPNPETRLLDEQRNDSTDSRFKIKMQLGNQAKTDDKVISKMIVKGKFQIDGKEFDYGEHWSGESNELVIDPKSDIKDYGDGVKAKILDVPYFNQWLPESGIYKKREPVGGWMMCGAASSVMVAGYFDKLSYDKNRPYSLKPNMSTDNGQGITATCNGYDPFTPKGGQKFTAGGAFAITSSGYNCSKSSIDGMKNYLEQFHMITVRYTLSNDSFLTENQMDDIKSSIDSGNPIIFSYGWSGLDFGHIAVIKGYAYSSNNQVVGLIFNDPYRNVNKLSPLKDLGTYSLEGDGAFYPFNHDTNNKTWKAIKGMKPKYMLVVKTK